jgi:hypothetical protein
MIMKMAFCPLSLPSRSHQGSFRPPWTLSSDVGAAQFVLLDKDDSSSVWECVCFIKCIESRFLGDQWLEAHLQQECNGVLGLGSKELRAYHRQLNDAVGCSKPLHPEAATSALMPYSFWSQPEVTSRAVALKALEVHKWEEHTMEERGVLELYGRVNVQYRPFLGQYEGESHYSMWLELMLVICA